MALLIFGVVKLSALIGFTGSEVVRAPIAFMSGMFWVWVSLFYIQAGPIEITHLSALLLGFGNFVAFFIGMLQLGARWNR